VAARSEQKAQKFILRSALRPNQISFSYSLGHQETFRGGNVYRGDYPKRFHAACRDTASASPMVAQLTSRSRRMSAISCIAAPILSKAPLYPAKVFNNALVGALPGSSEGTSCVVGLPFFSMIGRQSPTHSSQIKTPGPATRVFTSVCVFPQKEQRYSRLTVFWLWHGRVLSSTKG
jgi:hypothetical protein